MIFHTLSRPIPHKTPLSPLFHYCFLHCSAHFLSPCLSPSPVHVLMSLTPATDFEICPLLSSNIASTMPQECRIRPPAPPKSLLIYNEALCRTIDACMVDLCVKIVLTRFVKMKSSLNPTKNHAFFFETVSDYCSICGSFPMRFSQRRLCVQLRAVERLIKMYASQMIKNFLLVVMLMSLAPL